MSEKKRYNYKNILKGTIWLLLASGVVVLLVAAMTKKETDLISRVNINITGVQNHYFMDKKEVIKILEKVNNGKLANSRIGTTDLSAMEKELMKDQWIRKVEMFFDNNKVLQVNIEEREPVARIFTSTGNSFYIDTALKRLNITGKFSARLPVFTSFPTDVIVLTKKDSTLLKEIGILSNFISHDPFWMAQIEQIDITPFYTFDLIPKLGNQVIRFGNAEKYQEKFNNLLAFYKKIQTKTGWNRYSVVDVQFLNQVVAIKRDATEVKADSLRTVQIMKQIIAEAQQKMNDSTDVQLEQDITPTDISQSTERDEGSFSAPAADNVPVIAPVAAPVNVQVKVESSGSFTKKVNEVKAVSPKKEIKKVEIKKTVIKNIPVKSVPVKKEIITQKPVIKKEEKKEIEVTKEPKAVMPKKSDQ